MTSKLLRAALFWSFDLFELFCIGVFLVALAMCCSAYTSSGKAHDAPKRHKIETRAPEYRRPVKLAELEQGDEK